MSAAAFPDLPRALQTALTTRTAAGTSRADDAAQGQGQDFARRLEAATARHDAGPSVLAPAAQAAVPGGGTARWRAEEARAATRAAQALGGPRAPAAPRPAPGAGSVPTPGEQGPSAREEAAAARPEARATAPGRTGAAADDRTPATGGTAPVAEDGPAADVRDETPVDAAPAAEASWSAAVAWTALAATAPGAPSAPVPAPVPTPAADARAQGELPVDAASLPSTLSLAGRRADADAMAGRAAGVRLQADPGGVSATDGLVPGGPPVGAGAVTAPDAAQIASNTSSASGALALGPGWRAAIDAPPGRVDRRGGAGDALSVAGTAALRREDTGIAPVGGSGPDGDARDRLTAAAPREGAGVPPFDLLALSAPARPALTGGEAAAAPVAERTLGVPLDDPGFAPTLGLTLARLAEEGVQEARLQLNPAEMGPVAVQIRLDGQTATVDLQAALAGTREVLQEALPALAQAFAAEGLTLGGSSVGADAGASAGSGRDEGHAAARAPQSATGRERAGAGEDAGRGEATGRAPRPVSARTDGRLDLYA